MVCLELTCWLQQIALQSAWLPILLMLTKLEFSISILQKNRGQKRGIRSKLLYFYGKNNMYFATHKGLF